MSDLIDKQEAINAIQQRADRAKVDSAYSAFWEGLIIAQDIVKNIPSAEPRIIRCCDCKWWGRLEEGHPYGYCLACRSGTHTERWDISIYRQCKYDFYCADAEPRNDEEEEGEQ